MDKKSFKNKVGKAAKKEVDEKSHVRLYSNPEENKNAIKEMIQSGYIKTFKPILENYGVNIGNLICFLIDHFEYMEKLGLLQEDGSFYCPHELIERKTKLSDNQIKKYKKQIIKLGWMETKLKGTPAKKYYYLNIVQIKNEMNKTNVTIENNNENNSEIKINSLERLTSTNSNYEENVTIENNNGNTVRLKSTNSNYEHDKQITKHKKSPIKRGENQLAIYKDYINLENINKKNIKKEKKKEKKQKNNLSPKKEKTIFIQNEIDLHPEKDNINSPYPENINLPTSEKESDHMKKLDLIPLSEKEIKLLHSLKDKDPLVHVFRKYILPELKDNKQILYKVDKYIKHRQKVDKDQNKKKPTLTEFAMQLNALDINKYKRAIREYGPEFVLRVFEHTFKSPWKGIFPDKIEKEMDREKLYNQKSFIQKKSISKKISTDFKDPDPDNPLQRIDHER